MPVCSLILITFIYYFKLLTISIFMVKNIKYFKIKMFKHSFIIKTTHINYKGWGFMINNFWYVCVVSNHYDVYYKCF